MPMNLPESVKLVEVGPRDGLQNEKNLITVEARISLIERLAAAGLRHIEAGSFVSPKAVPQMAGSESVFAAIDRKEGVVYSALTPNMKGFERALAASANEVAVFAAASESFSQKNINCSIPKVLTALGQYWPRQSRVTSLCVAMFPASWLVLTRVK